ncbi:MAG: dihydroorotase [Treponema sp.]|jgi:dihydroorotase|nr:dihydroorotase [Treponema sp.]
MIVLKNFHIVDENTDTFGTVIIEGGVIKEVIAESNDGLDYVLNEKKIECCCLEARLVIDGRNYIHPEIPYKQSLLPVLMPALVDLHAHFRDPGFPEKETLESASLAAAAGGYGTLVCMANTKPVNDSIEKIAALKKRSDALGLIDLYPAMSLTKNMEGRELSELTKLPPYTGNSSPLLPRLLSEDGKDIAGDSLFITAMREAKRSGLPLSCHCDFGGEEAEILKREGKPRSLWSRIEENNAARRVIELNKETGCKLHIAHVSTREAVEMIRRAKKEGMPLSAEASPHHIGCTEEDAQRLGEESSGRVNPPLRSEEDRQALVNAILDGTIDAIATDHAPHSRSDKEAGAPGFSGLETAFSLCYTELVLKNNMDLRRLSALMSAAPSGILGFGGNDPCGRGRIAPGLRADLISVDLRQKITVDPASFRSRGKNSPFTGRELRGRILVNINRGRIIYEDKNV